MEVAERLGEKPACDECKGAMEVFGRTPPCGECMPAVMEENREAFAIWEYCGSQVVTAGMGEVIDISFSAVEIAMKRMGIERDEVFFQVVEIARANLAARRRKEE